MCTLSWIRRPDGYELGFNRDEQPTRSRGLAPRLDEVEGVRVLAPRDPDGGGTWIAVNGHGLTVALLNAPPHPSSEPGRTWRSRGLLVLELAAATRTSEVEQALGAGDLEPHPGFRLVSVERGAEPRVWHWDRDRLLEEPVQLPVVSGRGDRGELFAGRRGELERVSAQVSPGVSAGLSTGATVEDPGAAELERFHRSHGDGREPSAVCLHRPDASTHSFTWVRVEARSASMRYADGAPCRTPLGEALSIELTGPRERRR